jgi:hypothetical protein
MISPSSTSKQQGAPRIRLLEMILPEKCYGSEGNSREMALGRRCAASPERIGSYETLTGRVSIPITDDGRFEQLLSRLLKMIDPSIIRDADGILLATAVGEIELISRRLNNRIQPFVDLDRIRASAELHDDFSRAQIVASGCAAGLDALGLAVDYVGSGIFRSVLVIAIDAPLCSVIVGGFRSAGTLTDARSLEAFRGPFDTERRGFFLSEAAVGVLVEQAGRSLEVEDCRLLGWESVSSAYHMTGMRASGEDLYRACRTALERARVSAADLNWICCHGSGTRMNDEVETSVVCRLAESRKDAIPVCGFKGAYGHCLGAANLVDVAVCIRSCTAGGLSPLEMVTKPIERDGVRPLLEELPIGENAVWLTMASSFSGIHTAMVIGWSR